MTSSRLGRFLAICLAASAASSAQAQSSLPDSEITEEPIIVTPNVVEDDATITNAVRKIAPRLDRDNPITRFMDPLCLAVAGSDMETGSAIHRMITDRALEIGIDEEGEGCRPNALVIVTRDPEKLISALRRSQPRLFNAAANRTSDSGIENADAAIVWSTTEPRSKSGLKLRNSPILPGMNPTGASGPMPFSAAINADAKARRLGSNLSRAVVNAVVVLDARRLTGLTLRQISDYAAMRIFAAPQQVVPQTPPPRSILGLFEKSSAPPVMEMTAFDRAYLDGLYDLPINAAGTALTASVLEAYREQAD